MSDTVSYKVSNSVSVVARFCIIILVVLTAPLALLFAALVIVEQKRYWVALAVGIVLAVASVASVVYLLGYNPLTII